MGSSKGARAPHSLPRFIDTLRMRSLRFVIAFSFSAVTMLVTLFVGFSINNRYARAVQHDMEVSTSQIVDQVGLNVEAYLKGMMEVSDILKADIDRNRVLDAKSLTSMMETVMGVRTDIVSMAVFTREGELVATVPAGIPKPGLIPAEQEWFRAVVGNEPPSGVGAPQDTELHFITPHVQNLFPKQHPWVVSLSRPVCFIRDSKVVDGVLLVDMNFKGIDGLCSRVSLGSRGYVFVMDGEGNLVYHPRQQMIYLDLKKENNRDIATEPDGTRTETFDGARRLVSMKTLAHADWRIVGISFFDDLTTARTEVNRYAWFIIALATALALCVSVLLSAQISKPVRNLEKLMKQAENGDFTVVARIEGEEEVRNLSHAFNVMIAKIRALMDQIIVEQEQKRKSEIRALQAQINPHFLYNTLDSIVWMAENARNEEVVRMTEALARLFRISISRGEEFIPLGHEFDHARSYLVIQQIRYKDKFDFSLSLPPELVDMRVPKLILQPILENAIYHGIRNSADHGRIEVEAFVDGEAVGIRVRDDGVGMTQSTAASLLEQDRPHGRGAGVGLKNVHDRLRLYYGPDYGLSVFSEQDEGTLVTFRLLGADKRKEEETL